MLSFVHLLMNNKTTKVSGSPETDQLAFYFIPKYKKSFCNTEPSHIFQGETIHTQIKAILARVTAHSQNLTVMRIKWFNTNSSNSVGRLDVFKNAVF